ncbi:hypothetical protein ACFL2C_01650 [Patescibacteria group bacterium]
MNDNTNTNDQSKLDNPVGFPQNNNDSSALKPSTNTQDASGTSAQDVPSPDVPIPQTDQPTAVSPSVNDPTIQVDGNSAGGLSSKKILATILGLVLLVAGVATGVYLVGQQQRVSTRALECSNYSFSVTIEGEVSIANGTTQVQVAQLAEVYINDQLIETFNVPELQPGQAFTLGSVTVPDSGTFTWRVVGAVDCETSGEYAEGSRSSTFCSSVLAYDTDWNELSASELSDLSAGDMVRFAVEGTTDQGTFEAAKFTINEIDQGETTDQRIETGEFYMDYELPENTIDFDVSATIKHSLLGWF